MGGRDDATNVVDTVVCNVITSIGLDHMGFLGNTLAEIADVKSGIIRSQAPVCVGRQEPEALRVIQERCHKVGAHSRLIDLDAIKDEMRGEMKQVSAVLGYDLNRLKNKDTEKAADLWLKHMEKLALDRLG